MNPDFQRGHVWTEQQQIAFIEYFLKGGKSGKVIYFNHPHWGRYQENDMNMVCVDGLQRLTAIRRFINDEIRAFGGLYSEFEDTPRMIKNGIKFNVNDLQTKAEVLQWYLDMNYTGTPHTEEELDRVRKLLEEEKEKDS